MKNTVKMLALLMAIGLTGCATTNDLDTVRAQAQDANTTANAALKAANEAKAIAQNANATAQDAKAMAQDAKETSKTTETKIDRMFKKAMYK